MPCLSILIRWFPCKILPDTMGSVYALQCASPDDSTSCPVISFTFNTLDKDPRPNRATRTAVSFESRVHFQLISLSDPESRATSLKAGIHTISLDHYFHHVSASLIRGLSHMITETSKMTGHIRRTARDRRSSRASPGYCLTTCCMINCLEEMVRMMCTHTDMAFSYLPRLRTFWPLLGP